MVLKFTIKMVLKFTIKMVLKFNSIVIKVIYIVWLIIKEFMKRSV